MSCIIDNGYELGCASIGGVEKVYIGTYDESVKYTLDADNMITAVATGTPTVYLFEQDVESASLIQNGQFNRANLTVFQESILAIKLFAWTKELRNTYNALAKAPLFAVVKSNAGLYYLAGLETAGRATEGALNLGLAMGDMNGATISISWKSQNGVYLLDGSILGTDIIIGNNAS